MTWQDDQADTFAAELRQLQARIIAALEGLDGAKRFLVDDWQREAGGGGRTCVLSEGAVFEQAGVNFSDVHGGTLPPSASARHPDLGGAPFRAMGVSLVIHPKSPRIPTSHANVRLIMAGGKAGGRWWFGGGFDLTPYAPCLEDAVFWHTKAKAACEILGPQAYPAYKAWCDEYFTIRHRGETRGIGGLFFDDLDQPDFATCKTFALGVGQTYLDAYVPIVARHRDEPHTEQERLFQLYRRGRYVEFNLLYDRGTRFGLDSGGRTESILMSLPPLARWGYQWQPEPGSPQETLLRDFLRPRDWLGEDDADTP